MDKDMATEEKSDAEVDAWDVLGGQLVSLGVLSTQRTLKWLASADGTLATASALQQQLDVSRQGEDPAVTAERLGFREKGRTTTENRLALLQFLCTELSLQRGVQALRAPRTHEETSPGPSVLDHLASLLDCQVQGASPRATAEAILAKLRQQRGQWECRTILDDGVLSADEAGRVAHARQRLDEDYKRRGSILVDRLDVTLDAFGATPLRRRHETNLETAIVQQRRTMKPLRELSLYEIMAATTDVLAILAPPKAELSRSAVKQFRMRPVPDRGGRSFEP
mmetsp:Transcript_9911/g.30297  ORF Transcript_9911/g.30297 Transcript_9911/m.30297 type:complete len:281 (-) Transcript_9911:212-1054(-)